MLLVQSIPIARTLLIDTILINVLLKVTISVGFESCLYFLEVLAAKNPEREEGTRERQGSKKDYKESS